MRTSDKSHEGNRPVRSMTAYGAVATSVGGKSYKLQLKAVNHRFTEFRIRLPRNLNGAEADLRSLLQKNLERGSFDIWLEESFLDGAEKTPEKTDVGKFFESLAKALKQGEGISRFSLPTPVRALILSRFPDLWLKKEGPDQGMEKATLLTLATELCQTVNGEREREGAACLKALKESATALEFYRVEVQARYPEIRRQWELSYKERLTKASEDLRAPGISEERILQEILVLAERRDVAEELQRAQEHGKELNRLLTSPAGNFGKRLEFLTQELHREWTTLGNKIQSIEVSKWVVEAKLQIEKIKEQSLNLV